MKQSTFIRKLIKPVIVIAIILALIYYFRLFFTTGINYDDTFLKRESKSTETIYSGSNTYGDLKITVQGIKNQDSSAKVIYQLPNHIYQVYTVEFKLPSYWEAGIQGIRDEDGTLVFEGDYDLDNHYLIEKNGEMFFQFNGRVLIIDENLYGENYEINLTNVVDLVYSSLETIRGNYAFLLPSIVLFVIFIIDYRFPLFFFYSKHRFDVKDPEPSDMYLILQRVGWFLYPTIGIVLMIAALIF